ncbi:hypothetical protein PT974_01263 [Cladobotryum mycophilum]|uniref:Uncharacterized protein n=1 Tax=Cladobotryum mycophilum TaxID=491253 RepID=A0ABR0T381_9HYPO
MSTNSVLLARSKPLETKSPAQSTGPNDPLGHGAPIQASVADAMRIDDSRLPIAGVLIWDPRATADAHIPQGCLAIGPVK